MRAFKLNGIAGGVFLLFFACLTACAPSPYEELAQANKQLESLLDSNAKFYLQDELVAIRLGLQEAEDQLRTDNLPGAHSTIRSAKSLLTNSEKLYAKRLKQAEQESYNLIAYINFHLDSVSTLTTKMPRKTYVDQNRQDIIRFRIQSIRKHVQKIRQSVSKKDYLRARRESPHIRQSLNHLLQSVNIRPLSWELVLTATETAKGKVVTKSHASFKP
jgi:hypothetical protein